jgi:hypothetical protein
MKILFIGNSFSANATRYIREVSQGELFVRNLYIGGCSLETHARNIENDIPAYEYQVDAKAIAMTSIKSALLCEEWDVVSVQQVSSLSGIYDSYFPYIDTVIAEVRKYRPNARIVFHRTWAYNYGSTHPAYVDYNNDTDLMDKMIADTTERIAAKYAFDVIPSGVAVYRGYQMPAFDIRQGGESLTAPDTFHLSAVYGKYLAGLVLYRFFTGKKAADVTFIPEEADHKLVKVLVKIADETKI